MSGAIEFKQRSHLDPALTDPATRTLNAARLCGRWANTDSETSGITEIVIEQQRDEFIVSALAVGSDGPIAWPGTRAEVLANLEEEAGQRAIALAVRFDFGFMTAETYLRVNKGVLVIALSNTFNDQSGRSNYVNREFFCRKD
ncbi:MAG TPA: hypothetical protein VNO50_22090 [Pyrinomonadaceae bacterium]|nr:hypothetical protein [Pyrinomonadaceae bacterium]